MPADRTRTAPVVVPFPGAEPSDGDLVERALRGDRRAEEAIFRRHVAYLNGLGLRLLRDREEARDLVQDTFVDVFEQLANLRDPDQLRPWMVGIAVHKAHRRFRRRRLLTTLGLRHSSDHRLQSLPAARDVSPELAAELRGLDQALGQVPDDARTCWLLRHVEGYRLAEVASACGCSLATAKRRIARADAVVRRHVELEVEVKNG